MMTNRSRRAVHIGVLCCATWLLAACASEPPRPSPEELARQAELEQQQQAQLEAEQRRERALEKRRQREALRERLLSQADAALADGRLTLPDHDNAYDRYAAVLLLEPGNNRAENGLQSIVLAYADLVRDALRRGRTEEARQLLARAESFYSDNPLLNDLQDAISEADARAREQMRALQEQGADNDVVELPPAELTRRSEAVADVLAKVAQRVRETDASVLIMARTDAEGRWIYKQINDAVPGYRVRGDIRLANQPKLQLLPPL